MRERFKTANAHLGNGLKLLTEIRPGKREEEKKRNNKLLVSTELESADDYLVEAFTRFNIHSSLFGLDTRLLYTVNSQASSATEHSIPRAFANFRIARLYLDSLISAIYNLSHEVASLPAPFPIPRRFTHTHSHLRTSLDQWHQTFRTSLPTLITHSPLIAPLVSPLLQTYHIMSTILLSASLHPRDELIYDSHTAEFTAMLAHMRGVWETILSAHAPLGLDELPSPPGFTADMGFIPTLFFVVLKCRVGSLRREALEGLGGAPHREGLWDGILAQEVGRRVVEIEEGWAPGGLKEIRNGVGEGGVPAEARVYGARVVLRDGWEGKAELRYRRCGVERDDEEEEIAEVEVEFGSISSGLLGKCMFTGR
ncbi:hypothetical protein V494_04889 [Pseudogymnoascus sp. VKM F-4513 (FW-928)]|nr:hypothetical protein V494_04889 [Pseudogymnoascus sp. VKM F-4513 (FW-928)]